MRRIMIKIDPKLFEILINLQISQKVFSWQSKSPGMSSNSSSLQHNIPRSFCLVLVLWNLSPLLSFFFFVTSSKKKDFCFCSNTVL